MQRELDVTDAVLSLNLGSIPSVLPVQSQWMWGHSYPQQLQPTQMPPQSSSQFAVHPYTQMPPQPSSQFAVHPYTQMPPQPSSQFAVHSYTQMPPQPYGPLSTPQPQPYFLPASLSQQPHSLSQHDHQPHVHGWPPNAYEHAQLCVPQPSVALSHTEGELIYIMYLLLQLIIKKMVTWSLAYVNLYKY